MKVILEIDHTVSKEEIESWIEEILKPSTPCVWGYSFEEHHCGSCHNLALEKEKEELKKTREQFRKDNEELHKKVMELEDKIDMIDFFKEGTGLKKRGLINTIQVSQYIEKLEETIKEQKTHCKAVDEVNEKMKNFYNCSHSSRALCPNEYKCNGCKDWELAE